MIGDGKYISDDCKAGKEITLKPFRNVCVFCGSSDRIPEAYHRPVKALGHAIADRGLTLIYGGGGTGLMGILADAALDGGTEVIGVIPKAFNNPVLAHQNLTQMHVVKTMHERKAMMIDLAQAFITLPGGFGTLEELFEVLTWAQIGLHSCPIGVLNVNGYFQPLFSLIEQARTQGFIYDEHRALIMDDPNPNALLDRMAEYVPPENLERWIKREGES
jgi:uncharacterized protein (TIGR00730 family)